MLTLDQQILADLMSDISEECWFAGWYTGLENILWREITEPSGLISEQERTDLRKLSEEIGGWIMWDDADEIGTVFVPLEQWKKIYPVVNL